MKNDPDEAVLRKMGQNDAKEGALSRPESSIVKTLGVLGLSMSNDRFAALKRAYEEGYTSFDGDKLAREGE